MEMKKITQIRVEKLANLCLETGETWHKYTDADLINATLIFSHFLMDVIFTENQDLTLKKQCDLATYTGKAIRELILASTGKDMHKIIKL